MRKVLVRFSAVLCLAILGGYLLSQLFHEVDVSAARRSLQLLEIEESLDDAAINLGHQIQEWKDMLLRVNDGAQHAKHQQGFKEASIAVQYALAKSKTLMQEVGMDTANIDELIAEHKSLLSEYLQAYASLKPAAAASREAVDKQVRGVDRRLQERIFLAKTAISDYAKLQLLRAPQTQGSRTMMVGLLGMVALLSMAAVGYMIARRETTA